jgi:hypothetical protein
MKNWIIALVTLFVAGAASADQADVCEEYGRAHVRYEIDTLIAEEAQRRLHIVVDIVAKKTDLTDEKRLSLLQDMAASNSALNGIKMGGVMMKNAVIAQRVAFCGYTEEK